MCTLSDLGFSSFFEAQVADRPIEPACTARIAAEHRNEYDILTVNGAAKASLPGRGFAESDHDSLPKVGDWVVLQAPGSHTSIERVLTRRTALTRGAAGRASSQQILAANVDVVFIVAGLDASFNPNRIERYLSLVWAGGATPTVVLNKADLADNPLEVQLEAEGHCPGVEVIIASSETSEGIDRIRAMLEAGITGAFIGPSGVGKSTLINALTGEAQMDTGEVRAADKKGRHTTAHRQLILLPDRGLVIDTPGLRELQLTESEGIASVFPEIESLAEQCRFRDCRHQSEPGCAVKQAVKEGSVDRERYEHYLKLQHDAASFELRQNERLRRQTERSRGKLTREGQMIRRMKGNRSR
ncbi:ribosome small subunit-dependent GTPase A [bacterium]|nr:ribosome small subunit-dependent GTPase A [bacterium]